MTASFRLADAGLVLEFDLSAWRRRTASCRTSTCPTIQVRVATLGRLKARGHLGQIAISQDICYRSRLTALGGHGYGHVFRNVVPLMRRRGFSDAATHQILVATPARLWTLF
ncbi:MAG: hypothetical protein IPK33_04295 [Gemmatimonadetes bacterium]|nr:hypothetical protein [Gemmatimonadota bacterium]